MATIEKVAETTTTINVEDFSSMPFSSKDKRAFKPKAKSDVDYVTGEIVHSFLMTNKNSEEYKPLMFLLTMNIDDMCKWVQDARKYYFDKKLGKSTDIIEEILETLADRHKTHKSKKTKK